MLLKLIHSILNCCHCSHMLSMEANARSQKNPRWISVEDYSSLSERRLLQWLVKVLECFGERWWFAEHQSDIDVSVGMVNWGG